MTTPEPEGGEGVSGPSLLWMAAFGFGGAGLLFVGVGVGSLLPEMHPAISALLIVGGTSWLWTALADINTSIEEPTDDPT